jgi:hypothetical protein
MNIQLRKIIKKIIYCFSKNVKQLMEQNSILSRMGEKRNAYRLLVGKPEVKRPLGRPRRRWVDNIRMVLGEVGWGDMDWICLVKDRNRRIALVNSVLNLRVP